MSAPVSTIPMFLNPRSGTLRSPGPADVAAALARTGVSCELHTVRPDQLAPALLEAAAEGVPVVGVGGGDGTLRTAASILAGSDTALAVVPMGTLNHFARRLGIADLEDAVRALADRQTATVAIGMVEDEVFLNTAIFGEYAHVVRRRERWRRFLGKWPAAGLAFLFVFLRSRSMDVVIETSDAVRRHTTPLLWVGIGRGTFPRVAWTSLTDETRAPELEVVVARTGSRFALLRLLARIVTSMREPAGASEHPHLLEVLHTEQLSASARREIHATLDGEVLRFGPVIGVRLHDRLLRVVVPAPRSG